MCYVRKVQEGSSGCSSCCYGHGESVPAIADDLDIWQSVFDWGVGKMLDAAWDYINRTPLDEVKERAENGDAQAQYFLGLMYYSGEKVAKNYAEALK